jgi:hypothetical protein
MATNVTSLLRNRPRSFKFWVPRCGCGFAMLAIASAQCVRTLFLKSLPVSLHARLGSSKLQLLCLSQPRPGWYQSRADQLYLGTNRIRLGSLGGNRHDYRNCSYGTAR